MQNAQLIGNWIADSINTGDVILADGKVIPQEYFLALGALMGVSTWLPVRKEAVAEIVNATAEQKAAFIKSIEDRINVRNDKTEKRIESGVAIAIHIGTFFGD
jgi:hypothetical protein